MLLLSAPATAAAMDDKTKYNERAAARIAALFQSLDRNADDVVTREESMETLISDPASPTT